MKCKHLKDGTCEKLSDSEVKQPCVMGPCEHDTAVSELNKLEQAKATLKHLCKNAPSVLYAEDLYLIESLIDEKIKNARTASPRFTAGEREAMNNVIGFAKDGAEMGFENDSIINGEEHASCAMNAALRDIATVRKMLEGSYDNFICN